MQRCASTKAMSAEAPPLAASVSEARRKPKVVIVTGPTGVGKTECSLLLAERLRGEIISADSVQVYRGLDIGSDKLPLSERRGVPPPPSSGIPHHLIDICDVDEDFSAGDFHDHARRVTEEIIQRGNTPILVGGTSFYLRFYMFGKAGGPKASPALASQADALITRAQQQHAESLGIDVAELPDADRWECSVNILNDLGDAEAATRIRQERNNWYRLRRALEVVLATGTPMAQSAIALDKDPDDLDYDFRPFFLFKPRLDLYHRIDERVEIMMLGGLLDEAKALLDRGLKPNESMATRAIGYRQTMAWLLDVLERGTASDADIKQLVLDVQTASRGLLGSQLTFHRNLGLFHWVDAQQGVEAAVSHMCEQVALPTHRGGVLSDSGRLTDEEQYLLKRYQPRLQLVSQHLETVRTWLRTNGYLRESI